MIHAEVGNRVARLCPPSRQHRRGALDQVRELGIADLASFEAQRDRVRRKTRVPIDPVRKIHDQEPTSSTTAIAVSPAAHPVKRP